MAGIYFHIPFCQSRCSYCDFFSTTLLNQRDKLIEGLIKELDIRFSYLPDQSVQTIYFGGGTPSVLEIHQIENLINAVKNRFELNPDPEITLEANPDDLTFEYLKALHKTDVNRISIGIQSFDDAVLHQMNRRHSGNQAINVIKTAQELGFKNISIDLIYGWPGLTLEHWKRELELAVDLGIQHISAYHLTYHEGTSLWNSLHKGIIQEPSEELSFAQYDWLVTFLEKNGFQQYELSNFSLNGFQSRHNSSYWNQTPYLGLGPSAHSYNGETRHWNFSDLNTYLQAVDHELENGQTENLSLVDKFNDLIITLLRTTAGISMKQVNRQFGRLYVEHLRTGSQKFIDGGFVDQTDEFLRLTRKGMFVSDMIMEHFIILKTI